MIVEQRLQGEFGAVLVYFRKRASMTQKQLAQRLSMHANTISSWELGTYLPESRGLVLEMARHLCLNESETRQLLEASLTGLAPYWGIPLRRNPFFTGREEVLEALHTSLTTDQVAALTRLYAIHGLGGVGKTQLALEYAYRYALSYSALLWIAAETSESIIASLLSIADVLHLPESKEADQYRMITAVHHWLRSHKGWLLICDNVEDFDLLSRFLPPMRQGLILITTRTPVLGTLALGRELFPLSQDEGVLFLLRRIHVLPAEAPGLQMHDIAENPPEEYARAQELVRMMDGLPLALDQAGAYIDETGCSLTDYRQRYEQRCTLLLSRRGTPAGDHPQSVMATLLLACQRVKQSNPVAFELLCCCAFLSPDAIPEELFEAAALYLGEILGSVATDSCQFDLAIAVLRSFSLIQRSPETHTLSLHRLVQVVLREEMSEQERSVWQKRVIAALNAVFPEVTAKEWRQCERFLPHVIVCATLHDAEDLELANLLWKAANYLRVHTQYEQAQALYQQALRIREQVLGEYHPLVAFPLNGLALLFSEQGKFEQGEVLCQRALHIREQALGEYHPLVAQSLNNLAILYKEQGKYEQAERACQRALDINERTLIPENIDIAHTLNNLAIIYFRQGKYEQAEPLYQRALHIWEQMLGPENPQVAAPLSNLANVYKEQGEYEQAEGVCQRAIHIIIQSFGPEYPHLAIPLTILANIYREQGKYKQGETYYQRALEIWERALGPEHPKLADPLTYLANIYREQDRYEQAEPLYQRALQIREKQLGKLHPETAQTLHDMALFYEKQGYDKRARQLFRRACTIFEQSLGQSHPKTGKTWHDYQRLLVQGRTVQTSIGNLRADNVSSGNLVKETSTQKDDSLTPFLTACCELHPNARSLARELWQAYEQWVKDHHVRFPLSRRAFARQLQIYGLQAERTNRARFWRGITLLKKSL